MAITNNLLMPYNVDPTKGYGVDDPNDPTKRKATPDNGVAGPAVQSTPATPATSAPAPAAPALTFAQMQDAGQARPPVPSAAPSPTPSVPSWIDPKAVAADPAGFQAQLNDPSNPWGTNYQGPNTNPVPSIPSVTGTTASSPSNMGTFTPSLTDPYGTGGVKNAQGQYVPANMVGGQSPSTFLSGGSTNPVPNSPAPQTLPTGYTQDQNGVVSFQNYGGVGAAPLTAPLQQQYWDDATQSYKTSTIAPTQTQAQSDALIAGHPYATSATDPASSYNLAGAAAADSAGKSPADVIAMLTGQYGANAQAIPTYDANGNLTGTQMYGGGTASGPGLADIAAQNAINSAPSPQSLQATTGTSAAPISGPVAGGVVGTPSTTAPGTSAPATSAGGFDIQNFLTQGVQGQGPGSQVQSATNQAILNQLQNPNPYNSQTVQDAYKWLSGNIDDQYALQQKQLAEDAARRGLGASTIYAGNLNDLNIGKRSAQETLAQNLAQNLAQSQGQYQANAINQGLSGATNSQTSAQNWLSQLLGYGQQAFNNDLATNAQNQSAQQNWQNYVLQLLGLGYSPTG
jgi:hypothetical protein